MYLISLNILKSMLSMNKLLLISLFILMILPLVNAISVFQQNEDVLISKTARLNGAVTSEVSCNITIRDPDDITLVPLTMMIFNGTSGQQEFEVAGANNSKFGQYTYPISCIGGGLNKTKIFTYEINPSGKAYIPGISGPLIFGAILTLMFISIFLLVVGTRIELFPVKVFMIILAGIVSIMNIGFVAGSFREFFSSESALSNSFGTLYIAFIMLLTASSIFLMIWIILAGFKVYRVKRGFFIDPE